MCSRAGSALVNESSSDEKSKASELPSPSLSVANSCSSAATSRFMTTYEPTMTTTTKKMHAEAPAACTASSIGAYQQPVVTEKTVSIAGTK